MSCMVRCMMCAAGCDCNCGNWPNGSAVIDPDCPNGCSSHGHCAMPNATCECDRGFAGADCSARTACPEGCTAHGEGNRRLPHLTTKPPATHS